ncbi:acyltransferase family protein [Lysinibacillus sp. NPDC097287]|uniref:acyltransferase family protein n=1 Tax=Lysinibacillus sp. NPDC097287 TaxID=3364144 RepID=UPI00381018A9
MINTLTSLRFFAALAVFFSHLAILTTFDETKWLFERILYQGYLGVTFFFVLSGFILTFNYFDKFKTISKAKLKTFLINRVARIYPVYVLTFLLSITLFYFNGLPFDIKTLSSIALANLTLTQSFIPDMKYYFSFNSPGWSISDEMFFYLLFPFVIFLMHKLKFLKNIKSLVIICVLFYISCFLFVWFTKDSPLDHWKFYVFPVFRFGDFLIGVLLGVAFKQLNSISKKGNFALFTFLEGLSIVCFVIALYFAPHVHVSLTYGVYYLPSLALIIWVFAQQRGFFSRLLVHRKLIYLGEISFSFYLLHRTVFKYTEKVPLFTSNALIYILITLGITLALSHLVYKYFEIPMKNRIKYKFSRY